MALNLHATELYTSPPWAQVLSKIPKKRFRLGIFPTPLHPWRLSQLPESVELWIKRDDLSGMQLSGNKVRKLEFLLSEATDRGSDSIVTVGGIQSNHCRATAVAARMILQDFPKSVDVRRYAGMEAHLVLRNSRHLADQDPGLVGNLLIERLIGAHIYQVTKEEYVQHGSVPLGHRIVHDLQKAGKKPYFIPVGGSNALGTWGYLNFFQELIDQTSDAPFTDIVMACGSGGTTAGIALGNHLSGYGARIWTFGVCDDEEYFYSYIDGIFRDLGAAEDISARNLLTAVQAKGAGYAISQSQELEFIKEVAEVSGVILDPTYSGKALYGFLKDVYTSAEEWQGRKVVFLHTGGLLSMFDKVDQLQSLVESDDKASRHPVATA